MAATSTLSSAVRLSSVCLRSLCITAPRVTTTTTTLIPTQTLQQRNINTSLPLCIPDKTEGESNTHFRLRTHHDHPLEHEQAQQVIREEQDIGSRFKNSDHKAASKTKTDEEDYVLMHPVYSQEELDSVSITHRDPKGISDWFAYTAVRGLRFGFDTLTGYGRVPFTEELWLQRFCFLETVAGVPGMTAAMLRHLRSLRRMQRDYGWIHTLLEEAENERMHLLTFLKMKEPTMMFRAGVIVTQGVFSNMFFLAYLVSPRFCHRFVGYLEEEAVTTYTKAIKDLDDGKLPKWSNMDAPEIAISYWKLSNDAKMRDLLLAVRADEANHRHVNHALSSIKGDARNPFV
eukprot:m.45371 g.45371  ORF g.45371 m.45371 type:complete len:345 (+) comp10238_c0_seq1:182-1216(+)